MTRTTRRSTLLRTLAHAGLWPIYSTAYLFHRAFGDPLERRKRLWESRLRYALFFQGLPMFLALALIAATSVLAWRETLRHESVYADAARSAFEDEDYGRAALFYERLVRLKPQSEPYRYSLGLAVAETGDEARAASLIEPLAPRDRLGYIPAHLWVALRRIGEAAPSGDHLAEAEAHLLRLRRESAGLAEAADEGLVEIYARQGRIDDILGDPRLSAAAKRRSDLCVLLARSAARQGRLAEAQEAARELVPTLRRRVDEAPDDDLARKQLCEVYALLGEEAALTAVLRKGATIRPDGPFGEQWAETAVVRALRVGNSPTATPAEKAAARRDAMQLLDQYGRGTPRSQLLAGQMARLGGDAAEAERRYLKIVEELPVVRIELADLYLVGNRREDARRQWEAFAELCRKKLAASEKLSDEERLLVASAERQLGRYEAAERWLIDANQTTDIKAALTQLYAAWWDSVEADLRDATHLDVLRRGLRADPWNKALLARMLTAARAKDAQGQAARAFLKEMIVGGDLSATAYLLLGTDAYDRGDRETAVRYLEQARRLDPHSAVTLNNLAWTMFTDEKPDLKAALASADAAVTLSPGDPHFRDTRFRILAKLGRWREALDDLEFCASRMSGKPDFHRAAADVYDHLGLPDLAAEHRKKAGS